MAEIEALPDWIQGVPWERQRQDGELEPMLWFDRFDAFFRPVGTERSLLGAYNAWRKQAKKSETKSIANSWFQASRRWAWRERAEAWDLETQRLRLIKEEEQRQDMLKRHVQVAIALQHRGTEALAKLKDGDFSASDVRLFLLDGVKLERQARGLPEWLVAVAKMTDQELLDEWSRLMREGVVVDTEAE